MGLDESETIRPKVKNKQVWASLRLSPAEVIEQLFAEAQRRDPLHERTWLVLVDGQEAQLAEVEKAIATHRADTVVIQDFVHALEYLWKAAYCFHADGTEEAEALPERFCRKRSGSRSTSAPTICSRTRLASNMPRH